MLNTVIACAVFALVIGTMTSQIISSDKASNAFQEKMSEVKLYTAYRTLPGVLRDRIFHHFSLLHQRQTGIDENNILQDLPSHLRMDVAAQLNRDIIMRVPIFADCEPGFIKAISLVLQPQVFFRGDIIVRKGDIGMEMYFINRGKVDVLAENNEDAIASLHAGHYFGEIALQENQRRSASVRAAVYCDL